MADYDELDAMKAIAAALEPLEADAQHRALQWAISRFRGAKPMDPASNAQPLLAATASHNGSYATFAELYNAANPGPEKDKALVAAYWVQVCQNIESFPAQTLNTELKNLGYGVANITDALSQLKDDRPAHILQLKKSGTSKQARKTYKLTVEGIKRIEAMIRGELP